MQNKKILVQNTDITIKQVDKIDFISLTDIARSKNPYEPKDVVKNWLRSRTTIEFLGLWEQINNSDFKGVEFDSFKKEAGLNSFTLSPSKWIEKTNANLTYANEADILNMALFGMTAKQWRGTNKNKEGNLRDYASVEQLIILSNMESLNSLLITQNISQRDRLIQLNQIAISQMKSLLNNNSLKKLTNAN